MIINSIMCNHFGAP